MGTSVVSRLDLEQDPITRARAIAPIIAAAADRIEAGRGLPADLLDAMHGARLFRTLLPRDAGGEEISPAEFCRMIEIIAAADASTAWCVGQGSGCSMAAAYLKPDTVRTIWGNDPRAVLAWGVGPAKAQVVDDGYVVTGRWQFGSGSRHATWLGGHSHVIERDGSTRLRPDGKPLERTMLFRREVAAIEDTWQVMGLRGTGSDSYSVAELFVPGDESVCRDTDAERRQSGTLYWFGTTHLYASGFGSVALGIARGALDAFKELACEKTPSLTTQEMRESPVIQSKLGLAEAKLQAARSFLQQVMVESWELAKAAPLTVDQRWRIRMAATFATHQAKEVVDMTYHEAGATAIFCSNPFERRFRDVNAVTQQIQARASHFEHVGAHLLGMNPPQRWI